MLLIYPKKRSGNTARLGFVSRLVSTVMQAISMPEATPRKRLIRYAIIAVMLFTLLGGDRGMIRLIILLRDRAAMQSDIQELKNRRIALESQLQKYTSDKKAIEKMAREQLDMTRRGETVYKFPSP